MRFLFSILILILFTCNPFSELLSMEGAGQRYSSPQSLKKICLDYVVDNKVGLNRINQFHSLPRELQEPIAMRDLDYAIEFALQDNEFSPELGNFIVAGMHKRLQEKRPFNQNSPDLLNNLWHDIKILQRIMMLLACPAIINDIGWYSQLNKMGQEILTTFRNLKIFSQPMSLKFLCELQIAFNKRNIPNLFEEFSLLPSEMQYIFAVKDPQFAFEYIQKNNDASQEITKLAVKYVTDRPQMILPIGGVPFQFKISNLIHDFQTLRLIRKLKATATIAENVNCNSALDMYKQPIIDQYLGIGILGSAFSICSGLGGGLLGLCCKLFLQEDNNSIKIGAAAGAILGLYKFPAFVRFFERVCQYSNGQYPNSDIGGYNWR